MELVDASRLRTCFSHWAHRAGQERWIDQLVLPNQKESFGILWEIVQKLWLDTPFITTLLFYVAKGAGEATLSPRAPVGCTAPHPPEISCGSWLLAVLQRGRRLCSLHSAGEQRDAVLMADSPAGSTMLVCSSNVRF